MDRSNSLLYLAVLTLLPAMTMAQDGARTNAEILQSCLLGTPVDQWQALKLTPDQLNRMLMVQEACREECGVTKDGERKEGAFMSDGTMVLSEVDNILSTDQYNAWVAYCGGFKAGRKDR